LKTFGDLRLPLAKNKCSSKNAEVVKKNIKIQVQAISVFRFFLVRKHIANYDGIKKYGDAE
jgi:hypothetical protein